MKNIVKSTRSLMKMEYKKNKSVVNFPILTCTLLTCLFFSVATGCTHKTPAKKDTPLSTESNTLIVTAPIVFKNFVSKKGQATGKTEAYIRLSVQDYYIKFCESKVTAEELKTYLTEIDGEIKSITLEIELGHGYWDTCNSDIDEMHMPQSRTGEYAIIHRIITAAE